MGLPTIEATTDPRFREGSFAEKWHCSACGVDDNRGTRLQCRTCAASSPTEMVRIRSDPCQDLWADGPAATGQALGSAPAGGPAAYATGLHMATHNGSS